MSKLQYELMIEMLQDEAKLHYRGKIFWMLITSLSIVLNVVLFFTESV